MALMRWDPFGELNSLHDQVNSLFNDTFGGLRQGGLSTATDVYQNDKELVVEAHLPHFKDDEIAVEQHEGDLEIRAEHKEKEEDKGKKYLMRESVSSYYRRFSLPANTDADKISANYKDGILKVTVPFKELPQPKKIALNAENPKK